MEFGVGKSKSPLIVLRLLLRHVRTLSLKQFSSGIVIFLVQGDVLVMDGHDIQTSYKYVMT